MNLYFRQGIPEIDLYIERNTSRTPEARLFYVFDRGQAVGEGGFKSRRAAEEKYQELREAAGYGPSSAHVALRGEERRAAIAYESQEDIVARSQLFWTDFRSRRGSGRR